MGFGWPVFQTVSQGSTLALFHSGPSGRTATRTGWRRAHRGPRDHHQGRGTLIMQDSTRRGRTPAAGRTVRSARTRGRSILAALAAVVAVLTMTSSASAALTAVSGRDADTGFPTWYRDAGGLALQLCLDGLPNCFESRADLIDAHAAGGDGEAFYWVADAEAGPFSLHDALEAAYAADGPDQEVAFQRTEIRAKNAGLPANSVYTMTDPFGTFTCTTDATGGIDSNG